MPGLKPNIITEKRLKERGWTAHKNGYRSGEALLVQTLPNYWQLTLDGNHIMTSLVAAGVFKFEQLEQLRLHQSQQKNSGKVLHGRFRR